MRPENYPPQEPFSALARQYHTEVMNRGDFTTGEEISYGRDPYQRVLIWGAREPTGALFAFMHGGGWTNGYKEWMAFMAPSFTQAGITFASIGYRLAPEHLFPTGFDDACSGIALVAERAHSFDAVRSGLFVGGHSAGGHYAALMALTRPQIPVLGCLPISGVYDFGPASGLSSRPRFLGPPDVGAELAASPIANITPKPCPFLIAHGAEDFPHLIVQAVKMAKALLAAGGEVEQLALPGRNHFTASYAGGEPDGPWVPRAVRWISQHLK